MVEGRSLETVEPIESCRIRRGTARPKKNEERLEQWEGGEEEEEGEEEEIKIVEVKQRCRAAEGCWIAAVFTWLFQSG